MSMQGSCGTCKFSQVFIGPNKEFDVTKRHCFWGPPAVLGFPAPQGVQIIQLRPTMGTTETCGQFQRRMVIDRADLPTLDANEFGPQN